MDPLSVTASIIAILKVTLTVCEALSDAKDAPTDRSQFTTDISNLRNLLVGLLSRLDESSADPWHANVRAMGGKDNLLYQYRVALEQLNDKISAGHGLKKMATILLWKYIKDDAQHILLRLGRLQSLVQIALEMDHFKLSQAIESRVSSLQDDNKNIKVGVDAIRQDQDLQRHRLIIDWLSSDDFPAQHADFVARRQADTGLWFLDSPEFTEWVHGASRTLFCPGIPGAGKTMMAAIVVDHLHNTVQTPDVGVAYLYCNYKRRVDQTAPNLLAAILKQLVQGRPSFAQPLSSLYDHHQPRGTKLSLEEALSALQSVLAAYSKVYLVIDALDECPNQDRTRKEVLRLCHKLQGQSDLRLMATSRDIPDIAEEFKDMPRVEVRASEADVKRYVVGQIDRFAKCVQRDDGLQELVQNKVVEAVDGMFLLARLHVDSLVDKKTKTKVISALNNLSKGSGALNDAYDQAIIRIDGQLQNDRTLAKNVLSWISSARRPLTTRELCHALAVEEGDEELDLDNIPDVEDILSVCAGLVTVDEESQIVRLVHYTTQEYLEGICESWSPEAQRDIATTCLTYLCFKPFRSGAYPSDAEWETRLETHAFLDYSTQFWHHHLATVQEELSELALSFLQDNKLVDCAVHSARRYYLKSKGYKPRYTKQVTGLHLAATFGLLHLSKELLSWVEKETVIEADCRDSHGRTPLMCAAENGHKEIVELLLHTGNVDIDAENVRGHTALSLAAREGHRSVVEVFLSTSKVDINAKENNRLTPLMWAAYNGHKDTVELLLHTGKADINATDNCGIRQLVRSARDQHRSFYEFYLDIGKIAISADGNLGYTALLLAARTGRQSVVEVLLDTGKVNINAKDGNGDTALLLAAQEGHQSVLEVLLDTGKFDINAKNNKGYTALILAAKMGHKNTVELLLQTGKFGVNAKNRGGNTALLVAAGRGHQSIVEKLLVQQHIIVDMKSNAGRTPLMWAARNGYKDTVERLLHAGKAIVDAKDDHRSTPLLLAAERGHDAVVEVLLNTGKVDINAKDNDGDTSLLLAAAEGHQSIVEKLLVQQDIIVDVENKKGETALTLATKKRHEQIIELLRRALAKPEASTSVICSQDQQV